jgi:dTMP kinase
VAKGWLIAFEGVDGSGKSTQLARLAAALRAEGRRVVTTGEPTDGAFGRRIRAMAASGERPSAEEELRWFVEDRREHVARSLRPALAEGAVVLTDRYFLSTVAYQGARGHDPARLLAESEAEFPLPDLVLLLEIDPVRGLARAAGRPRAAEPAFEERAFLARVGGILRSVERAYLERIDAEGSEDEVAKRVRDAVARRLGL